MKNQIQVYVTKIKSPHWDYRIDVAHPQCFTICTSLVSGGDDTVFHVTRRLKAEMADLLKHLKPGESFTNSGF